MGFFGFIALVGAVWLLWNISRNTADALDKQTALQYEVVALEKRLDERLDELAKILKNGELLAKVELQSNAKQESKDLGENNETAAKSSDELININTATVTTLMELPKIGRATAQRIIEGRPFASIDDVKKVQGISEELFAFVEDRLIV